jgi:DNA polymerase/3'-5' exonuclease PolX
MMRQVAIDLGLTLNEYGLYDSKGKFFKANSEKEIFNFKTSLN